MWLLPFSFVVFVAVFVFVVVSVRTLVLMFVFEFVCVFVFVAVFLVGSSCFRDVFRVRIKHNYRTENNTKTKAIKSYICIGNVPQVTGIALDGQEERKRG